MAAHGSSSSAFDDDALMFEDEDDACMLEDVDLGAGAAIDPHKSSSLAARTGLLSFTSVTCNFGCTMGLFLAA